jgi:hypothetical protein
LAHHMLGFGTVAEGSGGKHAVEGGMESQRRDERDSLFLLAQLKHEDASGDGETVRVRNVSSGGLMADAPEDFRQGVRVEVMLEGIGAVRGVVAWSEAGRIGISFDHPIDKARARKPRTAKVEDDQLFRPISTDYRRPGLKSR